MASAASFVLPSAAQGMPQPAMKSITGGDQIFAKVNETAWAVNGRQMFVEAENRRQHTITHNFTTKDRKSYDAKTQCQPVKSLLPLEDELDELPGTTSKFLWVGIISGDNPKKYKNARCGTQKHKKDTTPMDLVHRPMPVAMLITESMAASSRFYVLCEPEAGTNEVCKRRHAIKISFHHMALFIFEEFRVLPHTITTAMRAKSTEHDVKQNLRYWSSINKQMPEGEDLASIADNPEDDEDLPHEPQVDMDRLQTTPGAMASGLDTVGHGIQTFLNFDSPDEYTHEDAHALLHELKEAHPTMSLTSLNLACRVRAMLQADSEIRSNVHSNGLPFLLEACQAIWPTSIPTEVEATAEEHQAFGKAMGATLLHIQQADDP
ncbi:hypothetical protein CBER1_08703 [Cercospora berteroae]|uniref:Uncharacterized protein n=1 Tax=Cercospora berteroae TaxID=357750 RepID=A0A2S6C6Q2_9PEZI|nr:hypothetical protein CBER1_08703 [Cercospora berteroae]